LNDKNHELENRIDTTEEEELMSNIDGLIEYLNALPKATVKVLNIKTVRRITAAALRLQQLLKETECEGTIRIKLSDDFNYGVVTVELEDLLVEKPLIFAEVIVGADNFEIYPLTRDKMRLSILFRPVWIPVSWDTPQAE